MNYGCGVGEGQNEQSWLDRVGPNFVKRYRPRHWLVGILYVSVSAAAAQVITATIPLPSGATAIAANSVANTTYIASLNASIYKIDGASNAVTEIPLPVQFGVYVIAIDSVTNKVYAASTSANNQVFVVDGVTNAVTSITVGNGAGPIAVNESTNTIYVGNTYDNTISVVDGSKNTVTATIPVGSFNGANSPIDLAVDSSLNKVYAILPDQVDSNGDPVNNLLAIDGSTNTVTSIPTAGTYALRVFANSATHQVFVLDNDSDAINTSGPATVAVIDGSTNTLKTTRPVGGGPFAAVLNPVTSFLYVANGSDPGVTVNGQALVPTLSVVNGTDLTVLQPHNVLLGDLYGFIEGLAVNTSTGKVFAGHGDNVGYLTEVDATTFLPAAIPLSPPATVPGPPSAIVAFEPPYVAVNSKTNTIYASEFLPGGPYYLLVMDGSGGSAPTPSIFPQNLYFQSSLNTTATPQTLYLANTGGAPMQITNLEFDSVYASSVVQSNDCPDTLAPQAVCPVSITYTPKTSSPSIQTGPFYAVAAPAQVVQSNITATVSPASLSFQVYSSSYTSGETTTEISGVLGVISPDPTAVGVTGNVPLSVTLDGVTATTTAVNGQFAFNITTPPLFLSSYTLALATTATSQYQASTASVVFSVIPQ